MKQGHYLLLDLSYKVILDLNFHFKIAMFSIKDKKEGLQNCNLIKIKASCLISLGLNSGFDLLYNLLLFYYLISSA